jgi:hypothetical protein
MERPGTECGPRPFPKWTAAGFVLSGVASVFGLGYMLYTAVELVRSGRGLETYHTFWLVEFNWIGFLVLFGLIPVALLVGLVFRLREHLQRRSLEKKYGVRNRNA